jgi:O-antigen/teichoic acid export membrane protein
VDRLLAALTVVNIIALFAVLLLGDALVRAVFGGAYAPVAANLPPLMLALVMLGVSSMTLVVAIVHERPAIPLRASAVRLVVFWVAAPPCIVWWQGSFGACIAVLVASVVHAALSTWGLRAALGTSLRSAAVAAALGAVFVPLLWLRGTTTVNIALFGVFLVGYATVLRAAGVVTREEVRLALRVLSDRMRWNLRRTG